MNIPLFKQVLEHIKAHPETHDQTQWHSKCGTMHCFAGWTEIMAYTGCLEPERYSTTFTRYNAQKALRLTMEEADRVFHSCSKIHHFEKFLAEAEAKEVIKTARRSANKSALKPYQSDIARALALGE